MVLAVMVVFLCSRVYQVVQPQEDKTGKIFRRAGNVLPVDVERPGQPSLVPDINYEERFDSLITRPRESYEKLVDPEPSLTSVSLPVEKGLAGLS